MEPGFLREQRAGEVLDVVLGDHTLLATGPSGRMVGRQGDHTCRLQTRDHEPTLSPSGVDQLLGREARPRPQVGEVPLDGAGADAHAR